MNSLMGKAPHNSVVGVETQLAVDVVASVLVVPVMEGRFDENSVRGK